MITDTVGQDDAEWVAEEEDAGHDNELTRVRLSQLHDSAMQTREAIQLRQTLTAYYEQNAPDNLDNVEALVARVVGGPPSAVGGLGVGGVLWTKRELFDKIEAKYGPAVVEVVEE